MRSRVERVASLFDQFEAEADAEAAQEKGTSALFDQFEAEAEAAQNERQSSKTRALLQTTDVSPAKATEQWRLGQDMNVPTAVARADEERLRQQRDIDALNLRSLHQEAPSLAHSLSDPNIGPGLRDDVAGLREIEKIARGVGRVVAGVVGPGTAALLSAAVETTIGHTSERVLGPLSRGEFGTAGLNIAKGLGELANPGIAAANIITGELFPKPRKPRTGATKKPDPLSGLLPYIHDTTEYLEGLQEWWVEGAKDGLGPTSQAILSGIESSAQGMVALLASVALKSPMPGLIFAGAVGAGSGARVAQKMGADYDTQFALAGTESAIEVLTEMVPGVKFIENLKVGTPFFQNLWQTMIREIGGEQVATFGQDMAEWSMLHPERTFGDFLKTRPSAAWQTLVATIVGTGLSTSVAYTPQAVAHLLGADSVDQGSRASLDALGLRLRHIAEQEKLDQLIGHAQGSAVLGRDQGLFEHVTGDTLGAQSAYISAEGFREYLQSEKTSLEAIQALLAAAPELKDQFQAALDAGGDIVVPLNRMVAALATVKDAGDLSALVRLTPEALTEQEYEDEVLSKVMPAVERETVRQQFREQSDALETRYTEEITNAGYSRKAARAVAQVYRSQYDTERGRLGDHVEGIAELDAFYNKLTFVGPRGVQAGGLQQTADTPHIVETFSGGREFDTLPGDPWVWVFHSTDDKTADQFLKEGVKASDKTVTAAQRGEAEYAPGLGLDEGLYVGGDLQSIPHARRFLAMRVRRSELTAATESRQLGAATPGAALAAQGALLHGDIPADRFREVVPKGMAPRGNLTELQAAGLHLEQADPESSLFKAWFKKGVVNESYDARTFGFPREPEVYRSDVAVLRAKAATTPAVVYHATYSDFTEFDTSGFNAHLGASHEIANNRALDVAVHREGVIGGRRAVKSTPEARVMPLYTNLQNPLRMKDVGNWRDSDMIAMALFDRAYQQQQAGGGPLGAFKEQLSDILHGEEGTMSTKESFSGAEFQDDSMDEDSVPPPETLTPWTASLENEMLIEELRNIVQAAGYDGIVYANNIEGSGEDSFIVFSPEQVKSAVGNIGTFDSTNPNILRQSARQKVASKPARPIAPEPVRSLSAKQATQALDQPVVTDPILSPLQALDWKGRLGRFLKGSVTRGRPKRRTTREVTDAAGQVWILGPPSTEQWIRRVESMITDEQITASRSWYANARTIFREKLAAFMPEEEADRYMIIWLMSNQNVSPALAMFYALRVSEQVAAGIHERGLAKGGLSDAKVASFIRDQPILEGIGAKLHDFVDSALGKLYRTIMGDRPEGRNPFVVDVHTGRDMGFIDPVYARAAIRALGVRKAGALPIDIAETTTTDKKGKTVTAIANPSELQYEWAVTYGHDLTRDLNARGWKGGGWTPEQVQAVGWTAVAKQLGSEAFNAAQSIDLSTRRLSVELAPARDFAGYAALDEDSKAEVTQIAVSEAVRIAVQLTGTRAAFRVAGPGGYMNEMNPAVLYDLFASREGANDVADIVGWMLKQNEAWHATPRTGGESVFLDIRSDNLRTSQAIAAAWPALNQAGAAGFQPLEEGGLLAGIRIMFDKQPKTSTETLERRVKEEIKPAIRQALVSIGISNADVADGRIEINKRGNDWTEDGEGNGYLVPLVQRYGPGIQRALNDNHLPAWQRTVGDAIDARTGTVAGATAAPIPLDRLDTAGGRRELLGRFGTFESTDTTQRLKFYNLAGLIESPAELQALLDHIGWQVKEFSFHEDAAAGITIRIPRLKQSYAQGVVWIYDPRVAHGSFKDEQYTRAWRVTHEIAHGIVNPFMEARYGRSRRYGRLGRTMRGERGTPPKRIKVTLKPLTLMEAQRAVEWEDVAFRAQRLVLESLGITIPDDVFAREYNVNLSDANYRVLSGDFGNPGELGFMPNPVMGSVKGVLQMLEGTEVALADEQGREPTAGIDLTTWQPVTDVEIQQAVAALLKVETSATITPYPTRFEQSASGPARQRSEELQELLRTISGGIPTQGWASATRVRRAGSPASVFRASRGGLQVDSFNEDQLGAASGNPISGLGVFFSNDQHDAVQYGPVVEEFHLDIRNPKIIRDENLPSFESIEHARQYRRELQAQGHDGLFITAAHHGGPIQLVAFDAQQAIPAAPAADPAKERVEAFQNSLREQLGLEGLHLYLDQQGDLVLGMLVVPRDKRKQGLGSQAVEAVTAFADEQGLRVVLSPAVRDDSFGTTSRSRLVSFYKRFGFVENTGRNTNFGISEGMYREPPSVFAQQARGAIQFDADRITISLFEGQDLSTALHEGAHFFLEVQRKLAELPGAPQQIVDDWAKVRAWIGSNPDVYDVYLREQSLHARTAGDEARIAYLQEGIDWLKTASPEALMQAANDWAGPPSLLEAFHEHYARSFERYIREGKAPSASLRRSFQAFKRWLVRIYKDARDLNVNLTNEVRGVFDRMLASDVEIEVLKNNPLFSVDPNLLELLTQEERRDYLRRVEKQAEAAKEKLFAKMLRQVTRETKAWWKEERAKVHARLTAEVASQRVYKALRHLIEKTGGLPRLDRQTLIEMFGNDAIKQLPRGTTQHNGMHPDEAAQLLGYSTGAELFASLVTAPPQKLLVNELTDREMVKQHGDILNDGTLEQRALEAMENDDRTDALIYELQVLGRRTKQHLANRAQYERVAADMLEKRTVQDVMDARQYYLAEVRAAREAGKALGRKDYAKAVEWKSKQLLNHMLYRESLRIKGEIEAAFKRFKKYGRPLVKGKVKIDEDYHRMANEIMAEYNLGPRLSQAKRARLTRDAIVAWIAEKQSTNTLAEFVTPPEILAADTKVHYRDMSTSDFLGLVDLVDNIIHQGRMISSIQHGGRVIALATAANEVVTSIETNVDERARQYVTHSKWKDLKHNVEQFWLMLMRARTLIRQMDGFKDLGIVHSYMLRDIDASDARRSARVKAEAKVADEIFKKHYGGSFAGLTVLKRNIPIPQLGKNVTLTKEAVLAVALNWGANRDALLEGHGWTEEQGEAILSKLDENDWAFVQAIWDHIGSFWPEIVQLDKKRTGVTPTKVDDVPFTITTAGGTDVELTGSYYPLKDDVRLRGQAPQEKAMMLADAMRTARFGSAQTKRGYTQTRQAKAKHALLLSLRPYGSHITEVITDLTMSEAIDKSWRVLQHPKVAAAIDKHLGPSAFQQLDIWLKDVAIGGAMTDAAFDHFLDGMRAGVSVSVMGFKLSTALVQLTGLSHTLVRLGPKWTAKGFVKLFGSGNPADANRTIQHAFELSPTLRDRSTTYHRDVYDTLREMEKLGGWRETLVRTAFLPIVKTQLAVDVITWLGAFEKGLKEYAGDEKKAAELADAILIETQGSGLMKELSPIERGTTGATTRLQPAIRMWTVFYSYYNTKLNLLASQTMKADLKKPGQVAILASDYLIAFWLEAALSGLILDQGPGDDDEDSWAWWSLKSAASSAASMFPLLREIAGGMRGFDAAPAGARGLGEISTFAQKVVKLVSAPEGEPYNWNGLARAGIGAASILFRIPGASQVNQILRTLERVEKGEDVTFMDFVRTKAS